MACCPQADVKRNNWSLFIQKSLASWFILHGLSYSKVYFSELLCYCLGKMLRFDGHYWFSLLLGAFGQ